MKFKLNSENLLKSKNDGAYFAQTQMATERIMHYLKTEDDFNQAFSDLFDYRYLVKSFAEHYYLNTDVILALAGKDPNTLTPDFRTILYWCIELRSTNKIAIQLYEMRMQNVLTVPSVHYITDAIVWSVDKGPKNLIHMTIILEEMKKQLGARFDIHVEQICNGMWLWENIWNFMLLTMPVKDFLDKILPQVDALQEAIKLLHKHNQITKDNCSKILQLSFTNDISANIPANIMAMAEIMTMDNMPLVGPEIPLLSISSLP